jgi:hypothetical protein
MYKTFFGSKKQITFPTVSSYYEFIGYLAKDDGSSRIVMENNDDQGAWGREGRIEFLNDIPIELTVTMKHTAGNSNIRSRVNCNEFIDDLINNHNFTKDGKQDLAKIKKTIPLNYLNDFKAGYNL